MEEKKPIHYLKSRKSDFLAGLDLEVFALEGKSCILTIKNVEYKENFKMNGLKKDRGLIVTFAEDYAKPFIVNPTNAREIKKQTGVIDASKWVGFSLDLYNNLSVVMRVSKTETLKGGIRIKKVHTNGLVPDIKDISTRLKQASTKVDLMSIWQELDEVQQGQYKENFTEKYKSFQS